MTAYRSTKLKLIEQHCPAALDIEESGAPRDREVFQVGIAAHAVLQVVGEHVAAAKAFDLATLGDAVVRELVTHGRAFEGAPEPPMSVAQASAGRDLALRYLSQNELSPSARYEHGLAVDADWQPVAYDAPDVHYRAAIDVFDLVEDADEDGYVTSTLVTTDWKSAWPTSADELDTVQLRGQAALALAHHPDATVLRRRAVNLRTRQAFEIDVVLDDDGRELVEQWRRDIGHLIAQAEVRDAEGHRPARPGAGCLGCPYLVRCPHARAHVNGTALDGSPERIATRFAVVDALRQELFAACKDLAVEGPIEIDGGRVGFVETIERKGKPDAGVVLAHRWCNVSDPDRWNAEHGDIVGLLTLLQPGATAADRVAKSLHPSIRGDKSRSWARAREQLTASVLTITSAPKFGIHKNKPTPEESEE